MWLVAFFAAASHGTASGNNNRLSTLWREVISLAGVARSLFKASSSETFGAETDTRNTTPFEKQEARDAKQRRN